MSPSTFNKYIDQADLIDIFMGVLLFTWSDMWGTKFSKQDRFLVIEDFLDSYPHPTILILEKNIPDHHLILVLEHKVNYGPYPFHLFHS